MNNLKKENGYVLVVIIGILTILSLMTITFATLSRIETRATRNYTDSVKCEKIAKAGLEHALYVLRLDKFGDDDVAYNSDNGDENYDWSGETWMPSNIDLSNPTTSFAGNAVGDCDNDGDLTPESKWIYFPATLSTSNSDIRLPGNLRARYAVLITDDREARVNVNVTGNKANGGSHTSNEGWSTFEIDLSNIIEQASTGNGDTTASDIIDARRGSDDAPGTSTPTNDDSGIVPDPQSDNIDNDGDWITGNDTNGNGIPDSGETGVDDGDNSESIDEPNEFNSIFPYGDDVPLGLLSEAEIMGTSSYKSRLEEIFGTNTVSQADQASLNSWLTTYSADTILCPSYQLDIGTSTTKLNINALVNNEGSYTGGYYDSDKKVEMIIDVLTAGGVPDVERQQMAVNIIDFIDSDDTVTIYNDGTDDYYGIERTPYINEVEAEVNNPVEGVFGKYIELFNPYDTDISIAGWTITYSGPTTITLGTVGTTTINARGYYVVADKDKAYESDFAYEGGTEADRYDVNVNLLTTTGEVLTLRDDSNNIVQVTNYGDADNPKSMQLNDPRPTPLTNHRGDSNIDPSNPWRWNKEDVKPGIANKNFRPDKGDDGWTAGTWTPSFLVANRRFSNKGYLGFVHNGRQWSSVRVGDTSNYPYPIASLKDLLEYFTITDPSMDSIDNDGDGKADLLDTGLQDGDFDGPEYRIPGLINVNTASTEVLASLPDGSGGTLGNTIAGEISNGSKPYESIGDLIDKVDGNDGITDTSANNKWDEEKRLRAISNLITMRSNVFTIYVTAQITNEDEDEVFAEKRILAIIDRSVDPIKVRYFRWLVE